MIARDLKILGMEMKVPLGDAQAGREEKQVLPVWVTVLVAVSRLSPTLLHHAMDHSIPDF